jgi:hypothetical protein
MPVFELTLRRKKRAFDPYKGVLFVVAASMTSFISVDATQDDTQDDTMVAESKGDVADCKGSAATDLTADFGVADCKGSAAADYSRDDRDSDRAYISSNSNSSSNSSSNSNSNSNSNINSSAEVQSGLLFCASYVPSAASYYVTVTEAPPSVMTVRAPPVLGPLSPSTSTLHPRDSDTTIKQGSGAAGPTIKQGSGAARPAEPTTRYTSTARTPLSLPAACPPLQDRGRGFLLYGGSRIPSRWSGAGELTAPSAVVGLDLDYRYCSPY